MLLPASARDQTVTKGGMIMMRLMLTSSARRVFQNLFLRRRKLNNKSSNLDVLLESRNSRETKFTVSLGTSH